MPVTTQAFKGWLKSSNNMKITSYASVLRLTHEAITNSTPLSDLDKKSIHFFTNICKNIIPVIETDTTNNTAAEASTAWANISSI